MLGQSIDRNNSQFEMVDKESVLVILKDATDFLTVHFVSSINSTIIYICKYCNLYLDTLILVIYSIIYIFSSLFF